MLRRASPGIDLSIGGPVPPDMTGPRQPGPVLWSYDGPLASPAVETRRALEISGLDRHFGMHDTLDAALTAKL